MTAPSRRKSARPSPATRCGSGRSSRGPSSRLRMGSEIKGEGKMMKKMLILGGIALAAVAAPAAAQPQPQAMADAPMRPHREARPITRADFQQRLQAHFAKIDVNRDGYVDRSETGG